MIEKEKKLIAQRLKSASRKDLEDILKLADFKVESIERLNLINTSTIVENVKSGLTSTTAISQLLARTFDISEEQAANMLKNHLNIDGLSTQEIVKRICERDGYKNKLQCIKDVKTRVNIDLKGAKDLVDECFENHFNTLEATHVFPSVNYYIRDEVKALLDGVDLERKLECVKLIKNNFDIGLYEAKRVFEQYIEDTEREYDAPF